MGAELTAALQRRTGEVPRVHASLEATGSGIARLAGLALSYPLFNWDDLPIKEGLHNRHMVGLTTWHAFFERTRLTLHDKRVLVVGYGFVGRGVADAARAYGGTVCVAKRDPVRALEAQYAGRDIRPLESAMPEADVIVTATGARSVVNSGHLPLLRDGFFLFNVGHHPDEIDVAALRAYPSKEVLPFVEAIDLGKRTMYLFAGGSMANLTAGHGDSLNAFDLTIAVMTAGIGYIAGAGQKQPPGVHILPPVAWQPYAVRAAGASLPAFPTDGDAPCQPLRPTAMLADAGNGHCLCSQSVARSDLHWQRMGRNLPVGGCQPGVLH